MSKSDVFNNQTRLIQKPELRQLVIDTLEAAPDYFYTMPASSTGKYHPAYTLGNGGLVRHTKAAVKIAECLLSLEMYEALAKKSDEIYAAIILHDSVKKGLTGTQYTTTEHPLDAAKLLIDTAKKANFADNVIQFPMRRVHTGADADLPQGEKITEEVGGALAHVANILIENDIGEFEAVIGVEGGQYNITFTQLKKYNKPILN